MSSGNPVGRRGWKELNDPDGEKPQLIDHIMGILVVLVFVTIVVIAGNGISSDSAPIAVGLLFFAAGVIGAYRMQDGIDFYLCGFMSGVGLAISVLVSLLW